MKANAIKKKHAFLNNVGAEAQELLQSLEGKPALTSALVLMAAYGSIDCPLYAPILLGLVASANHFFTKRIQKVILGALVAACISEGVAHMDIHAMTREITSIIARENVQAPPGQSFVRDVQQASHGQETPAEFENKGCGRIEALLSRPNGTAFIIQTTTTNLREENLVTEPENDAMSNETEQPRQIPRRVRLTEKREIEQWPEPGDSICYEASWYPVTPPTVPGAFNTREWLASQKLDAYGKFTHWDSWQGHWVPERSFHAFRQWIKSRFVDYLDPAETGLLLGLLAGDRSGIPEALRSDFQRSGLVHVLAISGFHVVLLAGILMVFLKATRLPHNVARIIAVLLLFIYIPITGGSPAVQRAVIMFSIPQLGMIIQRPANTLNSLGVALLFILLPDPGLLWNPGFQLSVAATAGILIGGKHNPMDKISDDWKRHKLWKLLEGCFLGPTYVTLCATLATAPFLIHHFKTLSPFAWFGNIVVVPGISLGMQAGLFALLSPFDFLREHFCYAAGFFLRLSSLLTRILSDSAEASITVGPYAPGTLLALGFFILFIPFFKNNRIARGYIYVCLLGFAVLYCIGSFSQVYFPRWEITSIDVGQGDSHLLTTPSGRRILVDSGDNSRTDSGKDIIVPYLHHIGVLQLDVLVITHPDIDHFGGAQSLIRMFPIQEIWLSECSLKETKEEWKDFLDDVQARGIAIRHIHQGFRWKENLFEIQVIHPREMNCRDVNTESITLRAKGLGHSVLLTGDLTKEGEKDILQTDFYLKSDILKLGHHGSKTSSSRPFLEAVAPQMALISCGRRNRFRHPSKQVISRLDSLHIPYLNTAEKGSITIRFTPDTMLVHTMLK